jgi:hypothetical protein
MWKYILVNLILMDPCIVDYSVEIPTRCSLVIEFIIPKFFLKAQQITKLHLVGISTEYILVNRIKVISTKHKHFLNYFKEQYNFCINIQIFSPLLPSFHAAYLLNFQHRPTAHPLSFHFMCFNLTVICPFCIVSE